MTQAAAAVRRRRPTLDGVRRAIARLAPVAVVAVVVAWALAPATAIARAVDVALVVSVDVSQSVDDTRYRLQMEGIAEALEDPGVIGTVTGGTHGAILFAMVAWADRSEIAVPWVVIDSAAAARAVAAEVRTLRRFGGEFTCLADMLTALPDIALAEMPARPDRIVVDVSGDGVDNCAGERAVAEARDGLVARGVTVNGLPIVEDRERMVGGGAYRKPGHGMNYLRPLETQEQLTLEDWYRTFVMGGERAFILVADGYADFARAMRAKFVTEISALPAGRVPTVGPRRRAAVAPR
jgi:hypothetical protein